MNDDQDRQILDDIEFLNMLSNPDYIEFLVYHEYPYQESFQYYLKYLEYI